MMQSALEWARGPAFVFALGFLVLGLARKLALVGWELIDTWRRAGDKTLPYRAIGRTTVRWLAPTRPIRRSPLLGLVSVGFHLSLLVVPVFLAGHVVLWQRGLGFSWPALPNMVADLLTITAIVTALTLVAQRALTQATRSLSRPQDYVLPLIIAVPFVSGFLVMHPWANPFGFEAILLVHVLSAELVLILIPITKLSHVALFPLLQLVTELGWRWPAKSGSRVAAALGKEAEPI